MTGVTTVDIIALAQNSVVELQQCPYKVTVRPYILFSDKLSITLAQVDPGVECVLQ